MNIWISGLMAGLFALIGSAAVAEDTPRPGLFTSAIENFSYAIKDVCFAYVFDGKDDVLQSKWGVSAIGWGAQTGFKSLNIKAHLIGVAGRINVGVKTENGVRHCEIEANLGDPNAYRQRLFELVAARPEPFSPLKSPISPNAYAFRDGWCGPPPSKMVILASTNQPGVRVAMRVTISSGQARDPRCDRTDIGPAVGAPVPVAPTAATPDSDAAPK